LTNDRNKSPLYFESSLKPIKFEQKLNYTEVFRQTVVMGKCVKKNRKTRAVLKDNFVSMMYLNTLTA